MNKLFVLLLSFIATTVFAQDPDVKTLQETAKTFQRQGDFGNAIIVLNKALEKEPSNIEVQKDLAFNYYLNHDYDKALKIGKPLTEKPGADVQSYQILGLVYKAIEDRKECEKLYKKGLKEFPNSGVLYNEYGEMLWTKQDYGAIKMWEKGIEVDPNYSGNYYNAAKHYYMTNDKVWSLIYGEMFLNLESYTRRTAEIKNVLLDGYKKLFAAADMMKGQDAKNEFTTAFLNTMKKEYSIVASGITPETLTMIRTKFILDWDASFASRFPLRLFDYQRQLLKGGLFDAYNQWLFGAAQNLTAFQNWSTTHTDQYDEFNKFQKGRVFKVPAGQYYQTK